MVSNYLKCISALLNYLNENKTDISYIVLLNMTVMNNSLCLAFIFNSHRDKHVIIYRLFSMGCYYVNCIKAFKRE